MKNAQPRNVNMAASLYWKREQNAHMQRCLCYVAFGFNPAGKIAEKAVWRSVFWTIWHFLLNADSTKIRSSSATF